MLGASTLFNAGTAHSDTTAYAYDALGRLVQVSSGGPSTQTSIATYTYDKADNRSNATEGIAWTSRALRTGDFDGDGKGDILWRDSTTVGGPYPTGTITDWLANSTGGWTDNWNKAASGGADTTWKIVGVGDFNGDGHSDILWRQDGGNLSIWLYNINTGGWISGWGTNVPPSWKVAGVGDFNGDGHPDILWRNDNGTITEWLGQANGSFIDNSANASTSAADNSWHVVGVGDFNGDGRADIVLRNDNGQLVEWVGNPNGGFSTNTAVSFTLDPGWKIVGVGDFNCDGYADLLFRKDNGDLTEWQGTSNGNFVWQGTPYYSGQILTTNLRVALIGNFNGDRINHNGTYYDCDDILWRDTAGNISLWLGSSGTGAFNGTGAANASYPTNWSTQPQ